MSSTTENDGRHPSGFAVVAAARALIVTAAEMAQVAVAWELYVHTRDPLTLGILGFAQFVPVLLFAVPAGQMADRFDRQRISVLMLIVIAVSFFTLLWIDRRNAIAVYALMFALGAGRAFLGPALGAWVASTIAPQNVARYTAVNSLAFSIAAIAGPAVGGLLLAASSATSVYQITVVLLVLAVGLLATAPRPPTLAGARAELSLASALDGLRFLRSRPALFAAVSMDFVAVFLGGVTALLPIFASDILHVGAPGLGALRAAPAVGAGLMGAWLSWRPLKRKIGLNLLVAVAVFGVATIVFGASTWFPLSLAMLAVLGAADMVSVIVRGALLQVLVPSEWRGRVAAVNAVFIGASNELGEMESGGLAKLIGSVGAVVVGGVGTIVVVVAVALLVPALRDVDEVDVS